MNQKHVLLIEDELKIANLLKDYLNMEGFRVSLLTEGTNAAEKIRSLNPDFVLLDLNLPGKDGITICREVRRFSMVPIFIITGKVDELDRLIGLGVGADDYICKPFSVREVAARLNAMHRRITSRPPEREADNKLSYKNVTLFHDRLKCEIDGQEVDLTSVERRILEALMSRPGRAYSRNAMMRACYSDGRIVSNRTIDSHVKNLRKKMSVVAEKEKLIHSIYGVGYKME